MPDASLHTSITMPSVFPSVQQPLPEDWAFEIPTEDEMGAEELDQKTQLRNSVLNNIHELVNVDAPDGYINPDFKTIPEQEYKLEALADGLAIAIPPQIGSMFYYATETVRFKDFKKLPKPKKLAWGVYALCYEKAGARPRLYIGSGTERDVGLTQRTKLYTNPKQASELPRHVGIAVKQGFELTHNGVVFSCPLPRASLVPKGRGLILAAESVFSHVFHAVHPRPSTDVLIDHLLISTDEATPIMMYG